MPLEGTAMESGLLKRIGVCVLLIASLDLFYLAVHDAANAGPASAGPAFGVWQYRHLH
jgi:hypothetical protein